MQKYFQTWFCLCMIENVTLSTRISYIKNITNVNIMALPPQNVNVEKLILLIFIGTVRLIIDNLGRGMFSRKFNA